MTKNTIVRTNDPEKRKFSLVVTGPVEQVVKINPRSVNLYGKPGEKLEETVTITPSEKYRFSILSMEQLNGSGVTATLIEPADETRPWLVKLSGTAQVATNLYDRITLRTDSKYRSVLTIRVSMMFLEQQSQGS